MTRINHQNISDIVPAIPATHRSGNGLNTENTLKNGQPTDGVQLSKLSSALNTLENGATTGRQRLEDFTVLVRSGGYLVDPVTLGRRIIAEAMAA